MFAYTERQHLIFAIQVNDCECDRYELFMFAGLFVGALIRYASSKTTTTHLTVFPNNTLPTYNNSLPPDTLWLNVI